MCSDRVGCSALAASKVSPNGIFGGVYRPSQRVLTVQQEQIVYSLSAVVFLTAAQYRPTNKKYLVGVTLIFLFVGPTPGHFLPPVSYPPKVSSCFRFAPILRTSIFSLTAAILKGCHLFRMRRGAGCWQPKRRLPPAATRNR